MPPALDYDSPAEAAEFAREFAALSAGRYWGADRPAHLLVIYRRLVAALGPFAQQLRAATPLPQRPPLLAPWLAEWIDEEAFDDALFDVQLFLDARGVPGEVLRASFGQPLPLRSTNALGILRSAPPEAVRQWTDLKQHYPLTLNDERIVTGYHLVLEAFFHDQGSAGTTAELVLFLTEILPHFEAKLPDYAPGQEIYRCGDWFSIWRQHLLRTVPNLPADDAYYDLDFSLIIRNLPAAIWWNNGLPYRNQEKAFHYYSQDFFWLARGGSLRKIPDHPPYSRRMAMEFLDLPAELNTGEADIYVYCFLRSLGCSHAMCLALQRFFHRPEDPASLGTWLQRLDPIVQKLRELPSTWREHDDETNALLGYVYHCFRDQPGFSISGRPIAAIQREADAYYARIAERQALAQRREAERRAAADREQDINKASWKPLAKVQPWSQHYARYERVLAHTITELTTREALERESATMHHCVGGYWQRCKQGYSSIWSLREQRHNGQWFSVLTIEISPPSRNIIQVRGRFNASPNAGQMRIIEQWAHREKLGINLGWDWA
ncbi:PcfJ domain-containing protein [Neolewinella lacunae]|uniref:PcfJ domain-containing protein n=1 Tax=Neolewinella lacunae TaxID=1517758 RepID=A0A923PLF6_9BACT|nr:PcfJ domain-containing protein [Neolewinella lacunae]MBC6994881.1 PcfJ domain-containing protein [Neolewinella lacunae]MDN3636801.1 PcfJ domain-containing protein [Neolewinella lacunae]